MKRIDKNKKKIIIISIIVILSLISFAVFAIKKDLFKNSDNKTVKEPIKESVNNTETTADKDETINSEEKKDTDVNNSTSENKKNENKDKINNSTPTNQSEREDKPESNNNISNSKPNNNDCSEEKPVAKPEDKKPESENKPEANDEKTPPVEEDKNNTKRKTMENTYGIKILYGDEIGNYKPKGITPTRLTDSNDIEKYLTRLNLELSKYPKGFFNDFNKKGMPLTIYLVKNVNGAFSGFTDYQFMNDIKLVLTTAYDFEYTFHHELMHYIDCYLDIVMYPNNPYTEYETLNPSGFVYGNATSSQIYNMGSNQRGAYFISSYGATHVKEDRAEVFKSMIARAYKPIGCFEPDEVIRKKAEVISKQIKTYFPSVTGSAHWDRFIN